MSLLLFLSSDETMPVHRRLVAAIVDAITSSRLGPGSPVPSSRELAESLDVSRSTVSKAYTELVRTGYIVTRPGGKTYVAETLPTEPSPPASLGRRVLPSQLKESDSLVSSYAARLMEIGIVANWGIAEASTPKRLLPIAQWKQIFSKYCDYLEAESLGSHPFGESTFRATIAKLLQRSRAVNCFPDQIITFPESQSGLNYVSQVLLNDGDLVIVEDPCFVNARNLFLAHGAEVLAIPVDDQGLQIDTLIQKVSEQTIVKLIYVTPSFQDPTGVCMSLERRHKLLDFARDHKALIVEDSWDGSHNFLKDIPPPLHALSTDANVFYLCSFWKALYPLSMVGCLVIPERFTPFFERAKMIAQEASPGIERTLNDFIESGHLERYLKSVVRSLTPARQKTIENLVKTFGQQVSIRRQSSAFWLTVHFADVLDLPEIEQRAQEVGLRLLSTSNYYADLSTARKNEFIIHFANIDNSASS